MKKLVVMMMLLLGCGIHVSFAAQFTPGNILVTQNDVLLEYTRTGELIQEIEVPHPNTHRRDATDIIVDEYGRAYVLNIAPFDNSYISIYDPAQASWTHYHVYASLGNGSDGDLSMSLGGKFAYNKHQAIYLEDFSTTDISIPGRRPAEISMGFDGYLYVLDSGSPRHGVRILDPISFEIKKTLTLRDEQQSRLNARGIAVTRAGDIFVSAWDGRFYAYDNSATLIDYCHVGYSFNDLDLSPSDGILVAGSRFGTIAVVDISFDSIFTFETRGTRGYVCFVPFENDYKPVPVADAGLDLVLSADDQCGASVILDGSASSDEGGNDLTYRWYYGGELFGEGVQVEASLGLGAHTFELIVNNGSDDSLPDEVVVTVVDDTPPALVVSTDIETIWPVNHKMVKITPSFDVADNCEGVAAIELVEVTCNQQSEGDIEVGDNGIFLRAKRDADDKDGRSYTLTYKATDEAGNETTASAQVKVPHNRRK